jgi:hypothetical protein
MLASARVGWVRGEDSASVCKGGEGRTLDTNMNVVLLSLLDLAGIFIRFRERVEGLKVLDGHTTVGERACRWGVVGV